MQKLVSARILGMKSWNLSRQSVQNKCFAILKSTPTLNNSCAFKYCEVDDNIQGTDTYVKRLKLVHGADVCSEPPIIGNDSDFGPECTKRKSFMTQLGISARAIRVKFSAAQLSSCQCHGGPRSAARASDSELDWRQGQLDR